MLLRHMIFILASIWLVISLYKLAHRLFRRVKVESNRNLLVAYCATGGGYVGPLSFVHSLYLLSCRTAVQRDGLDLRAPSEESPAGWDDMYCQILCPIWCPFLFPSLDWAISHFRIYLYAITYTEMCDDTLRGKFDSGAKIFPAEVRPQAA